MKIHGTSQYGGSQDHVDYKDGYNTLCSPSGTDKIIHGTSKYGGSQGHVEHKNGYTTLCSQSGTDKIHQCLYCSYNTKWMANMRRHATTHTPPTVKCQLCPGIFRSNNTLRHHMNTKHNILNFSTLCVICKDMFSSATSLEKHLAEQHSLKATEWTYQCSKCDRVYALASQLHGHWAAHSHGN